MKILDLNGAWRLRRKDGTDSDGLPCAIPGSVTQALVRSGELSDPRAGENGRKQSAWVAETVWDVSRDFSVDAAFLRHDFVDLELDAVEGWASVSVNGFPRGTTPVTLSDIPEGEASIEISAPGYRKFTSQMRVAAGDTLALHAPLEALPSSLTVVTIPAGARVYVDNVFKGNSPLELQEIAAGEYRVRVDMAGYDSMARNVTVKIDQQVTEEFKLAANIGSIRVSTAPAGVTILIDGKAAGKTVAADESSDTVSEPLLIPDVLQGPHTITFTRPGYGESVKSIEITRNQELSLGTVTLERKFIPDVIVHTRKDVYRGVYIEKTAEFYRIETSPGLIRSIPQRDITRVELIRTDAQAPAPETRR